MLGCTQIDEEPTFSSELGDEYWMCLIGFELDYATFCPRCPVEIIVPEALRTIHREECATPRLGSDPEHRDHDYQ